MMRKILILVLGAALAVAAGLEFHAIRTLPEPLVLGPGVTGVKSLSDYFPPLKGTVNDCSLYVLEGKQPGGTFLVLGGSHPEEPSARLAAWILAENGTLSQGRLIVAPSANRSGTKVTRPGGAYPASYTIPTAFGGRTFRMGDRWASPLDQWPDPEVFIHYPSKQNLAYMDVRNFNRAWPGRPDGTLIEKTCHAFIEMIRKEKVDVVIDLHEAELQYPVISTIVAHQKGADLAAMAAMVISGEEFKIGVEYSPKALRGLSHREIGDATDAVSLLLETPEPFLDATRGRTDAKLLLTGQDEFVVRAGKRGLLFETIDEKGWPIDIRVGRQTSTILTIMDLWSQDHPDRAVLIADVPRYAEIIAKGTGAFLKDPQAADPARIRYE
jgi:predicted deacylase